MRSKKEIAEDLLRIRGSQMLINEMYKEGQFQIPIHLALGHEAIAVAVDQGMEKEDALILSHRNMHYNLARNRALKPQVDEYLLKKSGMASGRCGSMNLINPERQIPYTSNVLGNNLAVAAGWALGEKALSSNGVAWVVTGDGAIEEGSFYESLLFLSSHKLNALVLIENNEWSMFTRVHERRAPVDIQKLTNALDIGYALLEGNDTYLYSDTLKSLRSNVQERGRSMCVEVRLTTLGSFVAKTPDAPSGKFINYHAGPASTVEFEKGLEIQETPEDPIFVLRSHFDSRELHQMSTQICRELQEEVA